MILMNDFKAEPIELREAMLTAARRVLESGWYVLGNEVTNFEKKWAATCGTTYCAGVGNGMDAIEISLRALGIGAEDEVITTSMTAFASALAILRAGATPVLADIDPTTALISIESVKRCISKKTKAILLVHLYGQIRNMEAWVQLCEEHNIKLIEDCAQSHLAQWQGKIAGSFGVAGAYSFYPTKNLGAAGDAGALVTSSLEIAEAAQQLRNYGQSVRYHHPILGLNSRLDELHAAMLCEKLHWLPSFTERRQFIAARYRREIINPLISHLAEPEEQQAHVYHLYVITCLQREKLQSFLEKNLQTLIHYPICIHQQHPCTNIKRDPAGLAFSESHATTCLSLPCHPQMSDDDANQVIHLVNLFQGA